VTGSAPRGRAVERCEDENLAFQKNLSAAAKWLQLFHLAPAAPRRQLTPSEPLDQVAARR
jgi:hypothetical protein